jgi:S-formylglutathione hydrolase
MTFSIFLPPIADHKNQQFQLVPALFWLSGMTCTDQNFVLKAGAQKYAAEKGIALICPDTSPRGKGVPSDPGGNWDFGHGAGFYINATEPPWNINYNMYGYVVEELPRYIFQHFPIDSDRVSIFGHSMGGHGALMIAFKNPGVFKSISAFAPLVSPIDCSLGSNAFKKYLGNDLNKWKQYDSCSLISEVSEKLPVLIDQGDQDEFLEDQLKTELLQSASERYSYSMNIRFQKGYDHSYFFISSFIEDHIKFHAGFLN